MLKILQKLVNKSFVNMLMYQALFSRLDLNIEPSVQSLRIKTDYLRKIFASSFEQNYITMKSYIDKGNMIVDYVNTPFSVFNAEGSFKITVHNENFKKFIETAFKKKNLASIQSLFGEYIQIFDFLPLKTFQDLE